MAKINNNNKYNNNNYAEFRLRHRPFSAGEHKKRNSNKKCQTEDHNNKGKQGEGQGNFPAYLYK